MRVLLVTVSKTMLKSRTSVRADLKGEKPAGQQKLGERGVRTSSADNKVSAGGGQEVLKAQE